MDQFSPGIMQPRLRTGDLLLDRSSSEGERRVCRRRGTIYSRCLPRTKELCTSVFLFALSYTALIWSIFLSRSFRSFFAQKLQGTGGKYFRMSFSGLVFTGDDGSIGDGGRALSSVHVKKEKSDGFSEAALTLPSVFFTLVGVTA